MITNEIYRGYERMTSPPMARPCGPRHRTGERRPVPTAPFPASFSLLRRSFSFGILCAKHSGLPESDPRANGQASAGVQEEREGVVQHVGRSGRARGSYAPLSLLRSELVLYGAFVCAGSLVSLSKNGGFRLGRRRRVPSRCYFAPPFTQFIPYVRRESVPLFLKRRWLPNPSEVEDACP
jgi:hypothetical protein